MNAALLVLMVLGASEARGICGRVVGPDGEAVAEAAVYYVPPLVSYLDPPVFMETKSNSDGEFRFDEIAKDGEAAPFEALFPGGSLLAYSSGMTLGSVFLPGNSGIYRLGAEPPTRQFEIRLERPSPVELELQSPSGDPLPLAAVRFELYGRAPRNEWPSDYQAFIWLPDPIIQKLECKTDVSGRVTLRFLSPNDTLCVAIETSEFGPMQAFINAQLPGRQIRLQPTGSIEGKVVAGDAKAVKRLPIFISSLPASAYGSSALEARRNPFSVSSRIETTTDDEGRFSIPKIGAGVVSFHVQAGETSEWQAPADATTISLAPGQTAAVEVPLVRAARITGRVVDDETGEALPGIPLRAGQRDVVTDMEGRFQVLSTSKPLWVEFNALPSPWLTPVLAPGETPFVVQFSPGIVAEAPEYRLKKGRRLSGTVVDENGDPVSGALVSASFTTGDGRIARLTLQHDCTLTDERGRFTLLRTNPAGVTILEARTEDRGLVAPFSFDSLDPSAPKPRLTVAPSGMVILAGQVVNEAGEPIAGARVHLSQAFNWQSGVEFGSASAPLQNDTLFTDVEGRFQTQEPLPRTRKYRLDVSAQNSLPATTEFLDYLTDDAVLVAPNIVLQSANAVSGVVVDASGEAVSGAIVSSPHGGTHGHGRIETTTDGDGRFRLAGLHPRAMLLFAQAKGFTMSGATASPGDEVRVVLHRPEELSQQPPLRVLRRPLEDRKRWLRALTDAIAPAKKSHFSEDMRTSIAQTTATIDKEHALVLMADLPPHRRLEILPCLGRTEEALLALASIEDPRWRVSCALSIAGTATEPEDRKSALAAAVASARQLPKPGEQAMQLAKAAQSYFDCGDTESARAVADEAREIVGRSPVDDRTQQVKAFVGGALALTDPAAALTMIEGVNDETSRRISLGRAAIGLAVVNPMEAERLYNAIEQEMEDKSIAKRVAHRMASVDIERARRFLDQAMERSRTSDMIRADHLNRAQAYGAMAMGVFKRDPDLARDLLREAMDKVHPEAPTYVEGDLIGAAFALLGLSQVIDPAASEEYFWRALACHRLKAFRPLAEDSHDHENAAKLVLFCLLYDRLPELRARVMEPIFQFWEAADLDDRSRSGRLHNATFVAMILTDPDRTIRWSKRYFSTEPIGFPGNDSYSCLLMVDALAADGLDLQRLLTGKVYGVWAPREVD